MTRADGPRVSREPWIKIKVNIISSDKMGELPGDSARWGWIKVLIAGKTQRRLGVFASAQHLADLLGRHARFIPSYVASGLLHVLPALCDRCRAAYPDERRGEVVIHDYRREQRDPTNADRQASHRGKGHEEGAASGAAAAAGRAGVERGSNDKVTACTVTSARSADTLSLLEANERGLRSGIRISPPISMPDRVPVPVAVGQPFKAPSEHETARNVTAKVTPMSRKDNGDVTAKVTADSRARGTTVTVTKTSLSETPSPRSRQRFFPTSELVGAGQRSKEPFEGPPVEDGRGPRLTKERLDAWASFRHPSWQPFKRAWLARGIPLPPPGSASDDEETSLRSRLWEIADARPNDLGRWVAEAQGRTVHAVIGHVFDRWSDMRDGIAAAGVEDDEAWEAGKVAERRVATGALARLSDLLTARPQHSPEAGDTELTPEATMARSTA